MPLQATSGAASYDAFGGGVAVVPNYIEEVFGTFLYTGNGSTQTITNGIDLDGEGGLVWIKARSGTWGTADHELFDTQRGATKYLLSNLTAAEQTVATTLTSFNSKGFSLSSNNGVNNSSTTYASWTFRKQPKFFDCVTYTGDGTNGRAIAHNLGSAPKFVIIKCISDAGTNWVCGMAGEGSLDYIQLVLNDTSAGNSQSYGTGGLFFSAPTSTTFSINQYSFFNGAGRQYVAYLFAHNAGGFGLTGTDNVISCGSFTTDGSGNASVNLGYEPQFWLFKPTIAARQWTIYDTMRGWSQTYIAGLVPNTAAAEGGGSATLFYPTATGFDCVGGGLDASTQHIYIAIRRGPMKVPTDGTKVFVPVAQNTGANAVVTTGFPVDLSISDYRSGGGGAYWIDRLRGSTTTSSRSLVSASTAAEYVQTSYGMGLDSNTTIVDNFNNTVISSGPYAYWNFARAPSFFDEVCYTGTGSATTQTHNLGVVPEMMIVKRRDSGADWWVYTAATGNTQYLVLNSNTNTATASGAWNNTTPTASVFSVGSSNNVNASAGTFVAYLFATCAGVSKVGSYTGNGSTQTIDCGFTGGARFVLIKRTDDFSGWYVYDTARGMTTLTDPYLLLNSTAAETATLGSVTTVTTGFAVNASILAAINTNSASYIFLAIA